MWQITKKTKTKYKSIRNARVNTKTRNRIRRDQNNVDNSNSNQIFIVYGLYIMLIMLGFMHKLNWYVVGWYVLIGVITYLVYYKDKVAAKKGNWRTPEATLHILSVAGGWGGAMIAQVYLRHKTRKSEFRLTYYLTVIINLMVLVFLLTDGDISHY